MSYLLQTSFKEAYGYVVGQSAAKGIRPVIQNTNGALATWPREWVFDTHAEAVDMLRGPDLTIYAYSNEEAQEFLQSYEPKTIRGIIEERYPLAKRLAALDEIMGI